MGAAERSAMLQTRPATTPTRLLKVWLARIQPFRLPKLKLHLQRTVRQSANDGKECQCTTAGLPHQQASRGHDRTHPERSCSLQHLRERRAAPGSRRMWKQGMLHRLHRRACQSTSGVTLVSQCSQTLRFRNFSRIQRTSMTSSASSATLTFPSWCCRSRITSTPSSQAKPLKQPRISQKSAPVSRSRPPLPSRLLPPTLPRFLLPPRSLRPSLPRRPSLPPTPRTQRRSVTRQRSLRRLRGTVKR
mmetsp:Transcript_13834/g.32528  ORF Transcript_13834/g.32528 Transcript_13834/m.32528 type:complete len:246 (-) Transcript_13834:113-850(-)